MLNVKKICLKVLFNDHNSRGAFNFVTTCAAALCASWNQWIGLIGNPTHTLLQ